MPSKKSRLTILSGSAIVAVAVSAAVAMADGSSGEQPAPAPAKAATTVAAAAAPKAAPAVVAAAAQVSRPAPAAPRVTVAKAAVKPVKARRHAKAAVIRETVPMAAPPAGVKVKMPTIKPRVRVPGTNADENGISLEGRPQMRLAMTSAETQPYWDRYNSCLHDHGVPLYPGRGMSPVQTDRDPAAEMACEGLMPRMPIAIDIDRNPHFARDLANEIACINAHGDPVVADPVGGFWTYREPANERERQMSTLEAEPQRIAIERSCELKAFGADD